jgi:nitrite reductase/ring-hydroxylating ferredoxin subunit
VHGYGAVPGQGVAVALVERLLDEALKRGGRAMKRLRTWKAHDHKPSPAYPPGVGPPSHAGWMVLHGAGEVKPGQVATRRLGRQDVVLWRTAQGALYANRAYCPHLGAHLGVGGTVQGDMLVCPFHGFRFDTTGVQASVEFSSHPQEWRTRRRGRALSGPGATRSAQHDGRRTGHRHGRPRCVCFLLRYGLRGAGAAVIPESAAAPPLLPVRACTGLSGAVAPTTSSALLDVGQPIRLSSPFVQARQRAHRR